MPFSAGSGDNTMKDRRLTPGTLRSALSKNFRMLVTIKDGRGFRVRGAVVSVSRVPGTRTTVSGMHAGFSNRTGVARVLVPVTTRMFGNRVFLKITARTPKARAVTLRSVLLPRLR
jgi:hypothetical protein